MGVGTDWWPTHKLEQPELRVEVPLNVELRRRGISRGYQQSNCSVPCIVCSVCPRLLLVSETKDFSLILRLGLWSEAFSVGSSADGQGPLGGGLVLPRLQKHFHFLGITGR